MNTTNENKDISYRAVTGLKLFIGGGKDGRRWRTMLAIRSHYNMWEERKEDQK